MPGRGPALRLIAIGAVTALLVLAATGIANALIDPFGITRWIEAPGFNAYRPGMATRVRLTKAWDVRRIRPRAIVLGTSRSHIAISMAHPGWTASPRFNLAFDGAHPEEMFAYLKHAQAVGGLKQVVLGLDTWHLEDSPSAVEPGFDPAMLLNPDQPLSRLRAGLAEARILLNADTAWWSWKTLMAQQDPPPDWLAPDGQRLGPVFFRQIDEGFIGDGPRAYFLQIDRNEIGFKMPAPEDRAHRGAAPMPQAPPSFSYIEKIVRFCRQHRIDLRIYITPSHAHQAEIAYLMGEWPKIEEGKRRLVALLADDARAAPGSAFPLWDFSGFSSVTTEALPRSPRAEMAWYWDSSHFKAEVGDWVLDRLFETKRPQHPVPADFGQRLTPQTIEQVLQRDRAARMAYEEGHPDDVALLKSFIAAARQKQAAAL